MHVGGKGVIDSQKSRRILDVVFFVVQISLMLGLSTIGYPGFMRSVAGTTCLWIGYVWVETKHNLYMPNYVRAAVLLAIGIDGFFGYYLGYYITSEVFDKLLHIFGTYAFSLFAFVLVAQCLRLALPAWLCCLFVVSLGISLGALYEIAEFLVDSWGHPILPGQLSLQDTNLDLIGDTVGALLAALHVQYEKFSDNRSIS